MTESRRRPTTAAEWVTFAIALAVVLAVVGAIASQVSSTAPPAPVVEVGDVEERGGRFVVPVEVVNRGDRTAQDVQVTATLTLDDGEVTSDHLVDFLAGGERSELEFVFEEDPADGELDVVVGGYALP